MNVHVVTWLDVEVSRCCNKAFWYYRYLGILLPLVCCIGQQCWYIVVQPPGEWECR